MDRHMKLITKIIIVFILSSRLQCAYSGFTLPLFDHGLNSFLRRVLIQILTTLFRFQTMHHFPSISQLFTTLLQIFSNTRLACPFFTSPGMWVPRYCCSSPPLCVLPPHCPHPAHVPSTLCVFLWKVTAGLLCSLLAEPARSRDGGWRGSL